MKTLSALLVAAAVGFVIAPPQVHADDHDKFTRITVNEPVQLPNLTLQPGKYSLKLLESAGNRNIVQVQEDNGKNLAIILALPNYRLNPKDKTTLQYWEAPAGQPRPIRAWFFPGDNYGQEFAYPKSEAKQIADYNRTKVATIPDSSADLKTAPIENFDDSNSKVTERSAAPTPAPKTQAQVNTEPPPAAPRVTAQAAPAPSAAPSPAPQTQNQTQTTVATQSPNPSSTPSELPSTASNLPLIGVIGALSLAGFLLTFRKRGRA